MLSKKMAFSLTSLITILVLAFVAPSVMAGEFGVEFDATKDISAADGHQLTHPGDANLDVTLKFAQAVTGASVKAKAFVTTYDSAGNLVGIPTVAAAGVPSEPSHYITLTVAVTSAVVKVEIDLAKGIKAADLTIADTSAEFKDKVVFLVGGDPAGDATAPTVYSMVRADNPLLKVTPTTHPVVQVIITLSEMAAKFDKDNLVISDTATITSVTALDPVPEDPNRFGALSASLGRTNQTTPAPILRGLYDGTNRAGATGLVQADGSTLTTGIHAALKAATSTSTDAHLMALADAVTAYNAANVALSAPTGHAYLTDIELQDSSTPPVGYFTETLPAATTGYKIGMHLPLETYSVTGSAGSYVAAYPDVSSLDFYDSTATALKSAADIEKEILAVDISPLDRTTGPSLPDPNAANYANALQLYQVQKAVYDLYVAEKAVYDAYMAAVTAEMEMDDAAVQSHYAAALGIDLVPIATGRDDMLYPYVVTITPKYANTNDIVLTMGSFEDTEKPSGNKYTPPDKDNDPATTFTEGVDQITIKVGKAKTPADLGAGTDLSLPHGEAAMIPANGYYILARDKTISGIDASHEKDEENKPHLQTPAQLLFNVRASGDLPNLENFFLSGGTIDLVAYDGTAATAAYISEVMWGSNASYGADAPGSQWIEIMNTTASAIEVKENQWKLWFYQANETPPAAYTGGTLIDRIGAKRSDTGVFWSVVSEDKGQSGRTATVPGEDVAAISPRQALISMIRVVDAAGAPADGTLPAGWAKTAEGTSVNFVLGIEGLHWATPGAADIARPTAPTPTPPTPPTPTVPRAVAGDIVITEIMVDSGNGRLPQWIELTHIGTGEVSLDGWQMVIDNARDADVIGKGAAITVDLSGELDVSAHPGNTDKGQSLLVVAWASARHSANIRDARVISLATQLDQTRQYLLLSEEGFRITLVPPQTGKIAAFGDVAGNLDEDWDLPMSEGTTRSSIIRRQTDYKPDPKHVGHVASMNFTGIQAKGWILASETSLATGQESYYGADEDQGTPGQDAGGPLPVELSHFRPARDKATGAVVITWATQSELNNAGFFIKRSNQRRGDFKVINATMIPGAGTTSEKQFYTYTDTTAQPNVVYYYQIEDVSLDGNRQTLTRGIRLKGHVGAAGKATTLWGELKTSHE